MFVRLVDEYFRIPHKNETPCNDLWITNQVCLITIKDEMNEDETISCKSLSLTHHAWPDIPYSTFLEDVQSGEVKAVVIQDSKVRGERTDGTLFTTFAPNDPGLVADLLKSGVEIIAQPSAQPSVLGRIMTSLLPFLLLIGFWIWFSRRQGLGGQGGALGFGKSRARRTHGEDVNVTLDDVAGIDEAKEEVGEMVNFLRDPERFTRVGGKIPRGVLMVGSPGTGKTLLARAIAGEAKVPFFSISGSDFVEMFVGVGASRVRDLFEQAKKSAPCIIFIDEIDAVGRRRGAGLGGGHECAAAMRRGG